MHYRINWIGFFCALFIACIPCVGSADNVSFNYQGRIKVQSQPFTGVGQFKLAILNTSGSAVLWSNDGTVGIAEQGEIPAPQSVLELPVTDGVFSVQVGDPTVVGMAPLDSAVMISNTPLRLRVWFSNGSLGFQELKPDHKLVDIALTTMQTGISDYTIYVNGQTGNDANNGLTIETAKKTINGAIELIPDKVRCNITVAISPGIYKEMVLPHGISVVYGKNLKFLGDPSWIPSSPGEPSVVVDAKDSASSPSRDYAMYLTQCTGITIEGMGFKNGKIAGLAIEQGKYNVNRCLASGQSVDTPGNGSGFLATANSYATFKECLAKNNATIGFCVGMNSYASINSCVATYNAVGVGAYNVGLIQFFDYNSFKYNVTGVQSNGMSSVGVWPNANSSKRTRIENNTQNGVLVNWEGQFTPADAVIINNPTKYLKYYGTIIGEDPQ